MDRELYMSLDGKLDRVLDAMGEMKVEHAETRSTLNQLGGLVMLTEKRTGVIEQEVLFPARALRWTVKGLIGGVGAIGAVYGVFKLFLS